MTFINSRHRVALFFFKFKDQSKARNSEGKVRFSLKFGLFS